MGESLELLDALEEVVEGTPGQFLEAINALKSTLMAEIVALRERNDGLETELAAYRQRTEVLETDLAVCKAAVAGGAIVREAPRINVLEPSKYAGKRCAKEFDNFVWQVDQYFEALRVEDDTTKIRTATLYLMDDAALWWRRRHDEIARGVYNINTWAGFKADLRSQFYPENARSEAKRRLCALKHTGSVKAYITEFQSLMLEIPDMAEEDRLLYFFDDLQGWAATEL